MPTVEIDGRRVEVPDGETVIQAAERLGVEIPHYCWHPGLPIAGNCRMCLVDIEKSPKLQIACNTRVTDGMVVHTTSEKTHAAQRAVLEFLLINHPIDCPVCDQAGECKLQEYYMDYDRQRSRVPLPQKVHKKKAKPIGPLVILDQERCILCSRCVRFVDEVTHTSELAFYQRGDHVDLDLAPGKVLDNKYSGNVVDICPVGALTSRDFPTPASPPTSTTDGPSRRAGARAASSTASCSARPTRTGLTLRVSSECQVLAASRAGRRARPGPAERVRPGPGGRVLEGASGRVPPGADSRGPPWTAVAPSGPGAAAAAAAPPRPPA